MSSNQEKKKELTEEFDSCERIVSGSPTYNQIQTPLANSKCSYAPPVDQMTPENIIDNSYSKNWCLTPNNNSSNSMNDRKKLKRLRRVGDCVRRQDLKHKDNYIVTRVEYDGSLPDASTFQNQNKYYHGNRLF